MSLVWRVQRYGSQHTALGSQKRQLQLLSLLHFQEINSFVLYKSIKVAEPGSEGV